ncbi:MAG: methyltransferase domain-containing protein [Treponemataceae bacterium]|nr:methyltransferase domain-containing protein [Treponemataceae bacterium]
MTQLEKYYNKFNEDHRLTTRHGQVEFNTTMHYILKYAQQMASSSASGEKLKILDLGAGTGRYSVSLLEKGFDLTAVELVKRNLEVLRSKGTMVKTWQGNAMDLHFLEDKTFDITLMLGPMYHLHSQQDKLKAFSEAVRVTKDDGLIFIGYVMNDYAIVSYCFGQDKINELLEKGKVSPDFHTVEDEDELYSYVRLSDIDELDEKAGVERVTIFAPDGPADYMRRELNSMSQETFQTFMDYALSISERSELLGSSSHTVDVVRKKDRN